MQFAYIGALLFSIACLLVVDYRYKLAVSVQPRRTLKTLAIAIAVFIVWDLFGIALGIFSHGESIYSLPVQILPEFPVEELFFLLLLTYVTLLIYRTAEQT